MFDYNILNNKSKTRFINQATDTIQDQIRSQHLIPYFVTVGFNSQPHIPPDNESNILNQIKKFHWRLSQPLTQQDQVETQQKLTAAYDRLKSIRHQINKIKSNGSHDDTGQKPTREYQVSNRYWPKPVLPQNQIKFIWDQYDKFQTHLVSNLINNHHRPSKRHLLPRTFDMVDTAGSRHKSPVVDEPDFLHIHSIYLIHPDTEDKFIESMDYDFWNVIWHHDLTAVRSVHAQPIASTTDDIKRVVDYSGKFIFDNRSLYLRNDICLYNQYPISRAEQRERHDAIQLKLAIAEQDRIRLNLK